MSREGERGAAPRAPGASGARDGGAPTPPSDGAPRPPASARLHLRALLLALALLSLALLVTLALVPLREHAAPWRAAQTEYNRLAARAGVKSIAVELRQIWEPGLGVVDRCPSCHLGAGAAAPIAGHALFAAHPDVPHDPRKLGCTPCHGGQGRATSLRAAHGTVRHWSEPLLEEPHRDAGCGTCHSHLPLPRREDIERGAAVVAELRCADCHRGARALATTGLQRRSARWHEEHFGRTEGDHVFAPALDEDLPAIEAYLRAQVGAPRLVAGKLLAQELGCRGCHRVQGVGGEEGPPLDRVGLKPLDELDFGAIEGPRTLSSWLRAHFVDPARVVEGSTMPRVERAPADLDALTTYMLSLRARDLPVLHTPRDRLAGLRDGAREFPTDGASLYAAFCVACHGPRGAGGLLPQSEAPVPAIGAADFLAIVSDEALVRAIAEGRPGRRMTAWGAGDGGLLPEELRAVAEHVRSFEPAAPSPEGAQGPPPDPARGLETFRARCAGCHGRDGEGSVVAPPLAASDNLTTRDESAFYGTLAAGVEGTAMGSFRGLGAETWRDLFAALATLPPSSTPRTGWAPVPGDPARGAALYRRHCADCHGERGEGPKAPALSHEAFLAWASDSYLAATIVRGREGTKMPGFGVAGADHEALAPAEVADVVARVRAFAAPPRR